MSDEMALEEEEEGGRKTKGEKGMPLRRTLFLDVSDLNLDTPEGQDIMLKRMQVLLATSDHNALDLNAFKILKDSVRVKTDLRVLIMFQQLRKEMDNLKERVNNHL